LQFIRDKRAELNELKERAASILNECAYFGIQVKSLSDLDETEEDLKKYESVWNLYESYIAELDELTKQDWLTYRKKTGTFEDFIAKWTSKLKEARKDSITIHIRDELDLFRQFHPRMKYIDGAGWTTEHW